LTTLFRNETQSEKNHTERQKRHKKAGRKTHRKTDRKTKRHKKADRKTDGKIEIFLKPPLPEFASFSILTTLFRNDRRVCSCLPALTGSASKNVK
jgi:hypothetical protein